MSKRTFGTPDAAKVLREDNARLRAENARLREELRAVLPFVRHKHPPCSKTMAPQDADWPCKCGLDAALRGPEATERPVRQDETTWFVCDRCSRRFPDEWRARHHPCPAEPEAKDARETFWKALDDNAAQVDRQPQFIRERTLLPEANGPKTCRDCGNLAWKCACLEAKGEAGREEPGTCHICKARPGERCDAGLHS